ncbi:MAG: hypothetical protein ACI8R9_000357 [Paraglaciecola sp.]|jgi:hypothetical protein
MIQRFLISVFTLALWIPLIASAGTRIINHNPAQSQISNLYIDNDMLATVDERGKTQFIFDNKHQSVTVVQHKEKRYMQVGQQGLTAMADGLNKMRDQAMSMMQQKMAGMSVEQRQQMEKMMINMIPDPSAAQRPVEWVKTSRSDKVHGVLCSWMVVRQEGKISSEACVAKLSDTNLNEKDYQTLRGFFDVIENVLSEFGPSQHYMQINNLMFDNNRVPLKLKDYKHSSGKEVSLEFISGSFDASLFTVPKEYQLQDIPNFNMPEN